MTQPPSPGAGPVPGSRPAHITVNGVREPHAAATLAALLVARDIDPAARGIAVALDGRVVPRAAWADTPIAPGATVEIVQARPGG
ncbi:sulfur carrier protein ThiS [Rhodoplanes serenus]|uniref:sulfur carrier protein ThiS n=1 Tax=Rhodoplanes serenus TaxID=200615 RepID=UPI000DAED7D9|nr:sulfur carrier protein ThiS [Rhodoplanes serenus]RAI36867.1 thiamine biosynthesis protein ThiS [Rhodoplanes serenus]